MSQTSTATGLNALRGADTATIGAYYDDWADNYDRDLAAYGYRAPAWVAARVAGAGIAHGAPVLDAGCGTGMTGHALHALGYARLTGADISSDSLVRARAKGCYDALHLQNLDQPLAFADDMFDAITCVGTLTYVRDPRALMASFCRVGRPGAVVIFTQRDDCYDDAFASALDALSREDRWVARAHDGPYPYLPAHPEYGGERSIFIDVFEVRG